MAWAVLYCGSHLALWVPTHRWVFWRADMGWRNRQLCSQLPTPPAPRHAMGTHDEHSATETEPGVQARGGELGQWLRKGILTLTLSFLWQAANYSLNFPTCSLWRTPRIFSLDKSKSSSCRKLTGGIPHSHAVGRLTDRFFSPGSLWQCSVYLIENKSVSKT